MLRLTTLFFAFAETGCTHFVIVAIVRSFRLSCSPYKNKKGTRFRMPLRTGPSRADTLRPA